jgi:hypothetical protein
VALSREFGWTPDQIRNLTMAELEIYAATNQAYRQHIDPVEISLVRIRKALYGFFGIKEHDTVGKLEEKIDRAAAKVTAQAKDAWIAAGMPSPAAAWFARYAKEHGDG